MSHAVSFMAQTVRHTIPKRVSQFLSHLPFQLLTAIYSRHAQQRSLVSVLDDLSPVRVIFFLGFNTFQWSYTGRWMLYAKSVDFFMKQEPTYRVLCFFIVSTLRHVTACEFHGISCATLFILILLAKITTGR